MNRIEFDTAPYVCPGCLAVGSQPHADYCLDAIIERERVAIEGGDYEPLDLNDSNDFEVEP